MHVSQIKNRVNTYINYQSNNLLLQKHKYKMIRNVLETFMCQRTITLVQIGVVTIKSYIFLTTRY